MYIYVIYLYLQVATYSAQAYMSFPVLVFTMRSNDGAETVNRHRWLIVVKSQWSMIAEPIRSCLFRGKHEASQDFMLRRVDVQLLEYSHWHRPHRSQHNC